MTKVVYTPMEVNYVSHMGTDKTVVDAARVSYDKADFDNAELSEKDAKLIHFLARHKHTSPFEHLALSVTIKCPLFVRSQIMRHRTFSYNEVSRRYTDQNIEFFRFSGLRMQSEKNFQCSLTDLVATTDPLRDKMHEQTQEALDLYHTLIKEGVSREQARSVLPQSLMTSFVMTGNALNWSKFLKLRLDVFAQQECQVIAQGCLDILRDKFPRTVETFEDHGWLSI